MHGNLQRSDDDDKFGAQTAPDELARSQGSDSSGYAVRLRTDLWRRPYGRTSRRAYRLGRTSVVAPVEPSARLFLNQILFIGIARLPNKLTSTPCT